MKRFTISARIPFLLVLAVCLCSLNACKKSKGTEAPKPADTFISFKANGVLKTYNVAGFNLFMEGNTYVCNINASPKDPISGESINLIARSQSPITKNTYGNNNDGSEIWYHPGNNQSYTIVNTDIQIVIDKIGDDLVQGSFTATIPTESSPIKLTEGIFKCNPRQ